MIKSLSPSYFQNHDTLLVANDLLGRPLLTRNSEGEENGGIIIETEAYMGPFDKASHAYNGLLTKRNEVMYGPGGFAYVYLCYGLHRMFNVVTNIKGIPHAILIRAIKPCLGLGLIQKRRKGKKNLGKRTRRSL